MVHYKLHYFDINGRAGPIRMLFDLAGVQFEDRRWSFAEWPEVKKEPIFLFGKAPILEVDGQVLAQSNTILRYLGNKYGFSGNSDFERAQVDALVDYFWDFFDKIVEYYIVCAGYKEGDRDDLEKSLLISNRDEFLKKMSEIIENNETHSGFLVGDSVTFMDLLLFNHVLIFDGFKTGYADGFPKVLALCDKIKDMPRMREHLEKRPERHI